MKLRDMGYSGTRDSGVSEKEFKHRLTARDAARESMVLLKNEGHLLPLPYGKRLALFGGGAVYTIRGGTGSGDVNERKSTSVREGIEASSLVLAGSRWLDDYRETYENARREWRDKLFRLTEENPDVPDGFFHFYSTNPFHTPEGRAISEEDVKEADTDTAMYVVSRIAGEGADRFYEKGDYLMTDAELDQIRFVCDHFRDVILVINTGAQIDLTWMDSLPNIRSVIWMGQAGMEGGTALANIVSGMVTPSGKLADTWAYHYEDYPCSSSFSHNNGDVTRDVYREGVYVGYRYFQSFGVKERYPFGYGLSYTDFSLEVDGFEAGIGSPDGTRAMAEPSAAVHVKVKNTGASFPGRETVQVYVSAPQTGLHKPLRVLAGFAKTKLLTPGQEEKLDIEFPMRAAAVFDETTHTWVLEKGLYGLWVGNSSRDVRLAGAFSVPENTVLEKAGKACPPQEKIDELVRPQERASRFEDGWHKELERDGKPVIDLKDVIEKSRVIRGKEQAKAHKSGDAPGEASENGTLDESPCGTENESRKESRNEAERQARRIVDETPAEDLIPMLYGEISRSQNIATLEQVGNAAKAVPGAAGETSSSLLDRWNIPGLPMADGPAGIRVVNEYEVNPEDGSIYPKSFVDTVEHGLLSRYQKHEGADTYYQYCTAFPTGSLLACSFDPDLIRDIGKAVGEEMEQLGITLWLAPGMNIHRDPLCGRNFEYYSEDPVLSGLMASAMTEGVQQLPGIGTTIKHFCCNNQEDNRKRSDSVVSERTLREIYLKGFEIAVRMSHPMAVMTSYNKVNGVHSANNRDLCTQILRREWGHRGIVMTDWTTTDAEGGSIPHRCMTAGNDLIMPGCQEDADELRQALKDGRLPEKDIRDCAARIIALALESNRFEEAVPYGENFRE